MCWGLCVCGGVLQGLSSRSLASSSLSSPAPQPRAQNWCIKRRSQSIYLQVLTDKHAPEHYRYAHLPALASLSPCVWVGRDSWVVVGPTLCGSLLSLQGTGQRVPVRGVWPGFPLPQRLTHEPCPQVLCVVSLATSPPARTPPPPCTNHCPPAAGAGMDRLWPSAGTTHLPSLSRPGPHAVPHFRGGQSRDEVGLQEVMGERCRAPRLGSREPDPLAGLDCPGPTFAVFLLLCLINKAAVLSCW